MTSWSAREGGQESARRASQSSRVSDRLNSRPNSRRSHRIPENEKLKPNINVVILTHHIFGERSQASLSEHRGLGRGVSGARPGYN